MKSIIIFCALATCFVISFFVWDHFQRKKQFVSNELEGMLHNAGIKSVIEIRKSKLDADDLKFKIWFKVPSEPRIVDVFWCDGKYEFEVNSNGQRSTLTGENLSDFLKPAEAVR